ncbi:MAG: hypothetical protein QNL61_11890 [Crocinitomicaceae bacterium]
MQRFIPLNYFKPLYVNHTDLLSEEGMSAFYERLIGDEGTEICKQYQITTAQFDYFVSTLKTAENIVFYGWVSYNTALVEILTDDNQLDGYEDSFSHLLHQLSEDYQRFISPYLSEKLLKFAGDDSPKTLVQVFSFVQLLDDNHRAVVEAQLFTPIAGHLNDLNSALKQIKTEQALIELLKPLCSDELIDCVNNLSRPSYALKLNYVDQLLNSLRSKSCTVRFANWVLKQLEKVELNREHEYKVLDLRRELQSGELKVQNQGKGKTPIRWKNVLMTTVFFSIVGFVVYVIVFKPFSDISEPELNNETSFKQFTNEERKQIDSLLRQIDGNLRSEDLNVDRAAPLIGNSSMLTLRVPFENKTMEEIYQDLVKDSEIQLQGLADSCSVASPFVQRKGLIDLEKTKGTVAAMMRNDSEFDVIVFLADEKKNGKVASLFLKKGETKIFEFSKGNTLLVVAGNSFQKFKSPSASGADLPSKLYSYHFCETDANFRESINTSYRLTKDNVKKVKFLLTGDQSGYFNLFDLKNVLETN